MNCVRNHCSNDFPCKAKHFGDNNKGIILHDFIAVINYVQEAGVMNADDV